MRPAVGNAIAAAVISLVIVSTASSTDAQGIPGGPRTLGLPPTVAVIPGQFIIELRAGVSGDDVLRQHGLTPIERYTIINGFAARMPEAVAERLARDGRVHAVTPDLVVSAFASRRAASSAVSTSTGNCAVTAADMPVFASEAQAGVQRIGAPSAWVAGKTGAGVKVAVIDTGIDPCHPDLSDAFKGGTNFIRRNRPPWDDNGHGTHVSGIIAARRNGFGVAGVAPDAWVYAVKVLNQDGAGSLSVVIKGVEWAARNGMKVANLSLGAFDTALGANPLCNAITNAVNADVTVVAAAGNSAFEALYFTPANCLHSLTVSAFTDTDGGAGGAGTPATFQGFTEGDDTFAETFSNYSNYCYDLDTDGLCTSADAYVVDLMAPGVEILSTLPTYAVTLTGIGAALNYDTLTGTSVAAPHVAGAAALVLGAAPGMTPTQVRVILTTAGTCLTGGTGGANACPTPWTDDPDFAWEPLVSVEGL